MFPGRPGHLRTFDYTGLHRYFLTFVTRHRRPFFDADGAVPLVLDQFRRAARDEEMAILAYCFMTDHVHLVVVGNTEASDLLRFIRRAKQFAGYYYKQRFHEALWQPDGYEHVLRNDEATEAVIKYVLENPLRAGLAKTLEEYPSLGSDAYSLEELVEMLQFPGGCEP